MDAWFTNISDCLNPREHHLQFRKTGFLPIDEAIGGFRAGELIVLASRPSMGKTSISMIIAGEVAINQSLPVAIFSMKHDIEKYTNRFVTSLVNYQISNEKLSKTSEIKVKFATKIKTEIKLAQIYVDDSPSLNIQNITRRCHELLLKCNGVMGLVVIDSFEAMAPNMNYPDKTTDATAVSKKLRELAREINCPILITTRLSRRVEQRKFKQPILSDLKHNGALSTHADRLLFLYRPQAYDCDSMDPLQIIDGKQRSKSLSVQIDDFISNLTSISL